MSTIATLVVKLLGDTADFTKNFSQAESLTQKVGSGMSKVGKGLTLGVTAPLVGAGLAAVNAASDLDESMNKVNVVFGDNKDQIIDWAKSADTNLGMTSQKALESVGTFGNLFDAMGVGQDDMTNMSLGLVGLASDLASFNNIDPTVALEKLRAGVVGEVEPLRSLGVNVSAAAIQAKALEMGLVEMQPDLGKVTSATTSLSKAQDNLGSVLKSSVPINDQQKAGLVAMQDAYAGVQAAVKEAGAGSVEHLDALQNLTEVSGQYSDVLSSGVLQAVGYVTTETDNLSSALLGNAGELSQAAKAQAAYAIIMEQTKNSQGDFLNTSDGLANSQRIISAQVGNLAAQFGTLLIPTVLQLVTQLKEWLTWLTNLSPAQQEMIVKVAALAAVAGPLLIVLGSLVGAIGSIGGAIGAVIPLVGAVAGVISGPLIIAVLAAVAVVIALYKLWTSNWNGIQDKTKAAIQWIQDNIKKFLALILAWWNQNKDSIIATVMALWETAKNIFNTALALVEELVRFTLSRLLLFWRQHGDEIKTLVTILWNTLKSIFSTALAIIQTVVSTVLAAVQAFWSKHGAAILAIATAAWNAIKTLIGAVISIIGGIIDAFTAAVQGDWTKFGEELRGVWDTAWNTIVKIVSDLGGSILDFLLGLIKDIIAAFTNTDWGALGRAIIDGLVAALKGGLGLVLQAAKGVVKAAYDAAVGFLKAKSPSRLFMDLGETIPQGLAKGIGMDAPVRAAMDNLTGLVGESVRQIGAIASGTNLPAPARVPVGISTRALPPLSDRFGSAVAQTSGVLAPPSRDGSGVTYQINGNFIPEPKDRITDRLRVIELLRGA